MKFLFDENLSHTLVEILAREFPNCTHIRDIGLRGAEDRRVWDHARAQEFMIVSKDTDFRERSYVEGFSSGSTSGMQGRWSLPSCSGVNVSALRTSKVSRRRPCSSCQSGRPRSNPTDHLS